MRRITLTLPDDVVDDVDILASHIGCSRSALVSLALKYHLSSIEALTDDIRNSDSRHIDYLRAKGESLTAISDRYREFLDGFEQGS